MSSNKIIPEVEQFPLQNISKTYRIFVRSKGSKQMRHVETTTRPLLRQYLDTLRLLVRWPVPDGLVWRVLTKSRKHC